MDLDTMSSAVEGSGTGLGVSAQISSWPQNFRTRCNDGFMLRAWLYCALVALVMNSISSAQQRVKWAVAVHGGAGEAEWEHMDKASADAFRAGLSNSLAAATRKLEEGASALDAVQAAILVLEDDPHFNAGRGAAFDAEGKNEMDASIMDGATLAAGAVAGVQSAKNPIALARAVMEHTPYVMLAGPGADAFASQMGLPRMPPSYFFTESRWQEFVGVMKQSGRPVPKRPVPKAPAGAEQENTPRHEFGTVGAVARDVHGNIAAGTSTGGMQGKMPGRVGDSPIIGAGTYAANHGCAVSSTGVGEYFIRLAVAKEISELVRLKPMPIQQAADEVIRRQVGALKGGEGGVIVLSTKEDPIWSYNTLGMFRARQVEGGVPVVLVEK
jgi:beta-aspartyl-peptidase (threonine type)